MTNDNQFMKDLALAESGDIDAQFNVGKCYSFGWGVKQDHKQAVKWFRRVAEQGQSEAQFHLGVCYDMGWGVKQDDKEAVKWYRKAAEQGESHAKRRLNFLMKREEKWRESEK